MSPGGTANACGATSLTMRSLRRRGAWKCARPHSLLAVIMTCALSLAFAARADTPHADRPLLDDARRLRNVARAAREFETAVFAAREIARIDPGDRDNRRLLGEMLARMGRYDEAYETLVAYREELGDDVPVLYLIAFVSRRRGENREAEILLETLSGPLPGREDMCVRAARYMHDLGTDRLAEHALRGLISRATPAEHATTRWARLELARLLLYKEDFARARETARGARLPRPPATQAASSHTESAASPAAPSPGAVDETGIALRAVEAGAALELGEPEEAVRLLEDAVERVPENLDAAIVMVRALRALDRSADAQKVAGRTAALLRMRLDENPLRAQHHNALAWFFATLGERLEQADELSAAALRLSPHTPAYLDTRAEIAYRRGDRDGAVMLAEQALSGFLGEPYYYVGQLLKFQEGQ